VSQRFSDAELASEMWHAMYQFRIAEETISAFGSTASLVLREHEAGIIHRFATLPHAHDPEPKTVYVYDATGRCIGTFPKPDTWTE